MNSNLVAEKEETLVSSAVTCDQPDTGSQIALPRVILSFDVEEHHRIEAAAHLAIDSRTQEDSRARVEPATQWLLDQLDERSIKATFFIVGEVAQRNQSLVRRIYDHGHEVASHSWSHERLHRLNPDAFRDDVRRSKDVLEQITGAPVVGYRAPTFSVVRQTAWAVDVLAELGLLYDSSIYPVRHDRYGMPCAPREPFWACGARGGILEFPPLTMRLPRVNLPIGGGGYFRLLPFIMMRYALHQMRRTFRVPVAMLYFHPWEFDNEQLQLPLGRFARFRTYVGISRSRARLQRLLDKYRFERAIDVARLLSSNRACVARQAIG
jgi:polysaccharide deacetylase family protein (PEP-CTERM system associated)